MSCALAEAGVSRDVLCTKDGALRQLDDLGTLRDGLQVGCSLVRIKAPG